MKKTNLFAFVIFLVGFFVALSMAFEIPQLSPGVTEISGCQDITSPGTYTLVQDVNAGTEQVCINVLSDKVQLDGQGFGIIGPGMQFGTRGINLAEVENFVIEDVRVEGFWEGIYTGEVFVGGSSDGLITDSEFTNNQFPVFIGESSNIVLQNSHSFDNQYGVVIAGGEDNGVFGSVIGPSTVDGVRIGDGALRTIVENNEVMQNRIGVFMTLGSHGTEMRNNVLSENERHGILTANGEDDLIIEGNQINNNGIDGIRLSESDNTIIRGNTVNGNGFGEQSSSLEGGIILKNFHFGLIENNTIDDSSGKGLSLLDSTNNIIRNVVASNSREEPLLVRRYSQNNLFDNVVAESIFGSDVVFQRTDGITMGDIEGNIISGIDADTLYILDSGKYVFRDNTLYFPANGETESHRPEKGQVEFIDEISWSGSGLDEIIQIEHRKVTIGGDDDTFDKRAIITMIGVGKAGVNPLIYRDGQPCKDCKLITSGFERIIEFGVHGKGVYTVKPNPSVLDGSDGVLQLVE